MPLSIAITPRLKKPSAAALRFGLSSAAERGRLLAWLDSELRNGRPGRVQAEYPLAFAKGSRDQSWLLSEGQSPVSHALSRSVVLQAGERTLSAAMIGLVLTDRSRRGAGMATRCLEAVLERLRSDNGDAIALLWSDKPAFYSRLGFWPAGRERLISLSPGICSRALRDGRIRSDAARPRLARPQPDDWPAIEALYAERALRVNRKFGETRQLASAPDCRVLVAHDEQGPIAYAASGRGDDFCGVVHEWCGDPKGVLSCIESLSESFGATWLLASPQSESVTTALLNAGSRTAERPFALVRILDPEALWQPIAQRIPGLPTSAPLQERELVDLIFAARIPPALSRTLTTRQREALRNALPWPLFVWGFDSV